MASGGSQKNVVFRLVVVTKVTALSPDRYVYRAREMHLKALLFSLYIGRRLALKTCSFQCIIYRNLRRK